MSGTPASFLPFLSTRESGGIPKEVPMCSEHNCGLCNRRRKIVSVDRTDQRTEYSLLECGHLHVFNGVGERDILWISDPEDPIKLIPDNWIRLSVDPKKGYFTIDEAQYQHYDKREGLFDYRSQAELFCDTYAVSEEIRFARKRWYGMIAQEGMKGMMQAIYEIAPTWHENTKFVRIQLLGFAMSLFPSEASQLFEDADQAHLFTKNMLPTTLDAYAHV